MIGSITGELAVRLATGVLFVGGVLAWRHAVPPAFFRFLVVGSAGAFAVSAILAGDRPELAVRAALGVLTVALYFVHRRSASLPRHRSRSFAAAALGLGVIGAAAPALAGPFGAAATGLAANLVAFAPGALLLGAVSVTMVLGHWYLVDTSLSIAPLATGARLYLGSAALRILVSAAALLAGGAAQLRIYAPEDLIYSTTALFFSFRALTGLLAPLVLAVLVRSTVRIRSTQSATGLLYVALILVLFGELTAVFLEEVSGGAIL